MFDGLWDKTLAPLIGIGLWATSIEKRMWGKVSVRECDTKHKTTDAQLVRLESHVWDIMRTMKIEPSIPVPEEIKNNSKNKN